MEDSWRHFTLSECEGGERIDDRHSIPDYWEGVGLQVVYTVHCTFLLRAVDFRDTVVVSLVSVPPRAYARERLANPRPSRSSHFPLPTSRFPLPARFGSFALTMLPVPGGIAATCPPSPGLEPGSSRFQS